MKQAILFIAALFLVVGASSPAADLSVPEIPDGEVRVYKSYYKREKDRPAKDAPLSKYTSKLEMATYTIETRWEGEGAGRRLVRTRKTTLLNGGRDEMTFTFATTPKFRAESFNISLFGPDGKKINEEYHKFTNPVLKYPEDVHHIIVCDMVLRGVDLKVGKEIHYNAWITTNKVFPCKYTVVGEETIATPAGTFECYKLEGAMVSADFSDLAGILYSMAVKKIYFWVEKGGSHGLVRMRIPTGISVIQRFTKYRTEELIEFDRGKKGSKP